MFQQMDKSGDNVEITNEALNNLKFLNSCIQECLRLYPTFQLFSRQVKTTVQLGNQSFKSHSIYFNNKLLH